MPMYFPDFQSLKNRATMRKFRQPHVCESENSYRKAFADFMLDVDRCESSEIRSGRGWDTQNPFELLSNVSKSKEQSIDDKASEFHKSINEDFDHYFSTVEFNAETKTIFEEWAKEKCAEYGTMRIFLNTLLSAPAVRESGDKIGLAFKTSKFRKVWDFPALIAQEFVYLGSYEHRKAVDVSSIDIWLVVEGQGYEPKYLFKYGDQYASEFLLSAENFSSHPRVSDEYFRLLTVANKRASDLGYLENTWFMKPIVSQKSEVTA